jgi:hypothetical protein
LRKKKREKKHANPKKMWGKNEKTMWGENKKKERQNKKTKINEKTAKKKPKQKKQIHVGKLQYFPHAF